MFRLAAARPARAKPRHMSLRTNGAVKLQAYTDYTLA